MLQRSLSVQLFGMKKYVMCHCFNDVMRLQTEEYKTEFYVWHFLKTSLLRECCGGLLFSVVNKVGRNPYICRTCAAIKAE